MTIVNNTVYLDIDDLKRTSRSKDLHKMHLSDFCFSTAKELGAIRLANRVVFDSGYSQLVLKDRGCVKPKKNKKFKKRTLKQWKN